MGQMYNSAVRCQLQNVNVAELLLPVLGFASKLVGLIRDQLPADGQVDFSPSQDCECCGFMNSAGEYVIGTVNSAGEWFDDTGNKIADASGWVRSFTLPSVSYMPMKVARRTKINDHALYISNVLGAAQDQAEAAGDWISGHAATGADTISSVVNSGFRRQLQVCNIKCCAAVDGVSMVSTQFGASVHYHHKRKLHRVGPNCGPTEGL